MGTLIATLLAVGAVVVVLVGLFVVANRLCDRLSPTWEARIRPWIFVGPACCASPSGLFVPTIRTIYLSLRGGDQGAGGFTLDHYRTVLGDDAVLNVDGASASSPRGCSSPGCCWSPRGRAREATSVASGPTPLRRRTGLAQPVAPRSPWRSACSPCCSPSSPRCAG